MQRPLSELLEDLKPEVFPGLPKEAQDSIMERFAYMLFTK